MHFRREIVRNLAHRGASGYAPENTMTAFHLAERLGADGFELDVQLTRDGVPVVIHDESLERTTNGNGLVQSHSFDEIRRLDAGSWYGRTFASEQIPMLEDVIKTFGNRMFLNIELKNSYLPMTGLEEKTLELIRRYQLEKRVIVSSFNHHSMQKFHALAPDIATGLLYDCCLVDVLDYAKRLGASALHPYYASVTTEDVQAAHAQGIEINVWTVNDTDDMQRAVQQQVNSIITNYPDRLRQVLDSIKK